MYFDLLNTTNTLSPRLRLVSSEAVQLVQSKIRRSNLQFSPVILLSTKIISLPKMIQNKITLKSTLNFITFYIAPVLITNQKSDFLQ